jgi:hypothetical protein
VGVRRLLFVTLALPPPFPETSVLQERHMFLMLANGEQYKDDALKDNGVSREAQEPSPIEKRLSSPVRTDFSISL